MRSIRHGMLLGLLGVMGCAPLEVVAPDGEGGVPAVDASPEAQARFSFFVTSLAAMQSLSGSSQGFGGDLRFGEYGAGAGLRGADKICAAIAASALPAASEKTWRAFLSTSYEHARDRIGAGPWYDRHGRLVANSLEELTALRPTAADPAIRDDLPNEDGVPNHDPYGKGGVDNHDVLTGSDAAGRLYGSAPDNTCDDWTSAAPSGSPRMGHSWPRDSEAVRAGDPLASWSSAHDGAGCAPGLNLIETGKPITKSPLSPTGRSVGEGGGYGAIYCFALSAP
ncbi:MAG: hypothetical protein QM778_31325 [Myxococcales bacterium]